MCYARILFLDNLEYIEYYIYFFTRILTLNYLSIKDIFSMINLKKINYFAYNKLFKLNIFSVLK